MNARFRFLQIVLLGFVWGILVTICGKAEEAKPKFIHVSLKTYKKDAVSGEYVFIFSFYDRKDGGNIRLKMGDLIGAYKIVKFQVKLLERPNNPTVDGMFPVDASEITLERQGGNPEKITLQKDVAVAVPDNT